MIVKIRFLHDARPYIPYDAYSNITFESKMCDLPSKGDIVVLNDITHPRGSFVVAYRAFCIDPSNGCESVELVLTVEEDM